MADALTPDGVRTRQFDVALRGYDRAQVDAFLADVATRLDDLERSVDELDAVDPALGIDDREALARELHLIGGEVGDILEAARSAAERMRSRAAVDAEAWTTDARERSDEMLSTAREQSHAARASAWKEGTALLASAAAEAAAMLDAAKEETLFVRAEAEREALRHTGDAKRDREETIRAARAEAEAIIEGARAESEGVLTAAHQQAEQAQERARALEDRRAELLAELEAARASISDMENEIETKRQELEAPVPELDPGDPRSHHDRDGGSVRIVAPSAVVPLSPVDAEELVAEVTALRAAPSAARPMPGSEPVAEPAPVEAAAREPAPETSRESEVPQAVEDTPTMAIPDATPVEPTPAEPTPAEPTPVEPTPVEPTPPAGITSVPGDRTPPDDGALPTPDAAPTAIPPVASPMPTTSPAVPSVDADAPTPEATPAEGADRPRDDESDHDDIDSLFAQLRSRPPSPDASDTPGAEAPPRASTGLHAVAEHTADGDANHEVDEDHAAGAHVVQLPDDVGEKVVEDGAGGLGDVEASSPTRPDDDEAQMVTARNAALRTIKRSLVELQNETLEHLRTDGAWMPTEDFTDRFHEPFDDLAAALTGVDDGAAGSAFGMDLFDAVSSAIERARSSGAGEREVAAAASKVFRMWRSDEAERRVIDAATVSA